MESKFKHNHLGVAVTAVLSGYFPEEDYKLARYGDCTAEVAAAQTKVLDRIARAHGFRDIGHLRNEVARRTSNYWVYKHFLF